MSIPTQLAQVSFFSLLYMWHHRFALLNAFMKKRSITAERVNSLVNTGENLSEVTLSIPLQWKDIIFPQTHAVIHSLSQERTIAWGI